MGHPVVESFISTLKSHLALDDLDLTLDMGRIQVADYIVPFYNPERRHSTLDYFSPIEYELKPIALQQSTQL